ncbi:MAG: hypothetical protein G01um101466_413 [Parcubacteria group bacterium Gr01-1014_66]|nr:MAG: hypothetical protein G01um101466_413 [Parcubacteria group bacterium Gr01-1014_66]
MEKYVYYDPAGKVFWIQALIVRGVDNFSIFSDTVSTQEVLKDFENILATFKFIPSAGSTSSSQTNQG